MSGETKSLGQKDFADRFYTKAEVAKSCVVFARDHIKNGIIHFIEPSAGGGAFLPYLDNNYDAFDILPQNENVQTADWFEVDKSKLIHKDEVNVVIGNPPFGVQSTLAIRFFNESAFADYIAFIVPKSFKKPSVQNKLSLNFELVDEIDLPKNSFVFKGEDYDVNCVFQVWRKTETPREKVKSRTTSPYFDFTKDKSKATCSVRRVGAAAGKASTNLNFSEQSNYFLINKTNLTDEQFIDFLNSLAHDRAANAVGPKSLSKSELVEDFEANYGG